MRIQIRVDIDSQYGSFVSACEVPDVLQMAYAPLKICDDDLIAYTVGEVTEKEAKKVIQFREDAAEKLAKKLTDIILCSMKSNDTLNGYPLEKE